MKSLLCLLCLVGVSLRAADPAFDDFTARFTNDWVRLDPQLATTVQFFAGEEQDTLDRKLTPVSSAFQRQKGAVARHGLVALAGFDRTKLSPTQQISAAMLESQLQDIVGDAENEDYRYAIEQFNGAQAEMLSFLNNSHPIRNERDAENYLARLEQIPGLIDDLIADAQAKAAHGLVPPRFIIDSTVAQMETFAAPAPSANLLVLSLSTRASQVKELPATRRAELTARAEALVKDAIVPAYRRAIALLREHRTVATDEPGITRRPGGDRAYAHYLRKFTTTSLSPDEVHQIGLREVARIETEMDAILRQLGYPDGSIKSRYQQLEASLQPPDTLATRVKLIADYTRYVRDAEKRCAEMFDLTPKAPVDVRREPEFSEKTAAAHYSLPARDGSRPGIFWAPLPGATFPIVSMRSLSYHEAVPGHHFQCAIQAEMTDLPRFRSDAVFGFISSHGEGWALYAERLAAENHWYDGDPVGHLGQLYSSLFRARRLVVDTGLHTKGWTRQQAIDYGIPPSEVERYVVWPGQACSYKIGELKLVELREKARQALGDKFSIKSFHNLVLKTGGVPLNVLEELVNEWIASQQRPAA